MWRTIRAILCDACLPARDSAILARLIGNSQTTCSRCGKTSGQEADEAGQDDTPEPTDAVGVDECKATSTIGPDA